MEALSKQWKFSREKMEVLKKDPQEFVRRWGPWYNLSMADVESAAAADKQR